MAGGTADWVGVIHVGAVALDCRLFSAGGRAKPLPLRTIHVGCKTVLAPERGERTTGTSQPSEEGEATEPSATDAREQLYCPRCQKALRSDEIGRAVETETGLVVLTDAELASLTPEPCKEVRVEFVHLDNPVVWAVGTGRRLYVFPKPAAVKDYTTIFHLLREAQLAGFIRTIVIKRVAYPAVLRPLTIPSAVFGAARKLLVLDVLEDTDKLKDPDGFPDFVRELGEAEAAALASHITGAQARVQALDPDQCVSPRRRALKDLLRRKMEAALRR